MTRFFTQLSPASLVERLCDQLVTLLGPCGEKVNVAEGKALDLQLAASLTTNELLVIQNGTEGVSALARLGQNTRQAHANEATRLEPVLNGLTIQVQKHNAAIVDQVQRAQSHCQPAQEVINIARQSESTMIGLTATYQALTVRTRDVSNDIEAAVDRMRALERRQGSGR